MEIDIKRKGKPSEDFYDYCRRIAEKPGKEPGYDVNVPVGILRGTHAGKRGTMVRSAYRFAKVEINGELWWVRQFDLIQERNIKEEMMDCYQYGKVDNHG